MLIEHYSKQKGEDTYSLERFNLPIAGITVDVRGAYQMYKFRISVVRAESPLLTEVIIENKEDAFNQT
jgi:hypothetical protein